MSKTRQEPEPEVSATSTDTVPGTHDIPLNTATKSKAHKRQRLDRRCESVRKGDPTAPARRQERARRARVSPEGPSHRFGPTPGLNFPPVMEEPGLQVLIPPPSEGARDLPANNRNQPFYKLNFHLLCPLISGRVPGSLVGAAAVLRGATQIYYLLFSEGKTFPLDFSSPRM